MKATETARPKNHPRLFKPELKFIDFWYVSNDYVQTTSLNEKTKKEVIVRIHDFSLQLRDTFALYPTGNKKTTQKTYNLIATGLKESVRRAKISLALNKKHDKAFAGYWKFLVEVLKNDARLLKDEQLQDALLNFEEAVRTIKVK